MQKIDLFIAGAQKAGTTSMKNYLGEHPQITTHVAQEFSFFYDDQEFNRGLEYAFSHYFYKQSISNNKIVCKHAHFYTSEKAIIRLSQHNPDCKLIIILRNPVERAYSSYLMEKLYSRVHFEFDEIVYALDGSNRLILEPWQQEAIISFGFYSIHLKNILKYFPEENVWLVLFDDFKKHPLTYVKHIFGKMGVEADYNPRVRQIHNQSSEARSLLLSGMIKKILVEDNEIKKGIKKLFSGPASLKLGSKIRDFNKKATEKKLISKDTQEFLVQYFKPYNDELSAMTGIDLSHWNEGN